MDIVSTKVLVGILFGLVRFLAGILPIQLYKWLNLLDNQQAETKDVDRSKREKLIGCCLALFQSFGGGVLFATCFLHMMPEVYYCVEELRHFGTLQGDYPYSQLIVSSGFFLVYFVEEVSQYLISITPPEGCPSKKTKGAVTPLETKPHQLQNGEVKEIKFEDADSPKKIPYIIDVEQENQKNLKVFCGENLEKGEKEENEELGKLLENEVKNQQQLLRCVLIVIALSLHAIFEGLAIGLQHSVGTIWYLFVSVSIHSATILFCMGTELLKAKARIKAIVTQIFILSVTSPIGVFAGLAISLTTNPHTEAKSLIVVILEGLSAGTILYITFFEVLNREKEMRIYRLRRALCIISGFALMAVLESAKIYN